MNRKFHTHIRYSAWDGTQQSETDPDQILSALAEDLMEFGDLEQAMRYLSQRGMQSEDGSYIKGLRELLRDLRAQKNQRLERYDMGSVLDSVRQQLDEILNMERGTIDEWINQKEARQAADRFIDKLKNELPAGHSATGEQPKNPAADQANNDHQSAGGSGQDTSHFSQQVLGDIGRHNRDFLDQLPEDTAGQVSALQQYEFLNTEAQKKFLKLIDDLRKSAARSFFQDVENMVKNLSQGDLDRMKAMLRDLNAMLVKKIAGEDPGFEDFMKQYGDMFGPNPPKSLDELLEQMQNQMAATQSLMNSLTPEQQQQLQSLMADRFGDPDLENELMKLAKEMAFLNPRGKRYDFSGNEALDLQAAMDLMKEMQDLEQLEKQLQRAQYDGNFDKVDADRLEALMGEQARENLDQLNQLMKVLEEAGYASKNGDKWELT
ncbi:MAG: hypothetical protein KDI36_19530, partial [Pseudomonadales bacterium]|nr:hypothetical protein [Pseudomonadales bacterium]